MGVTGEVSRLAVLFSINPFERGVADEYIYFPFAVSSWHASLFTELSVGDDFKIAGVDCCGDNVAALDPCDVSKLSTGGDRNISIQCKRPTMADRRC